MANPKPVLIGAARDAAADWVAEHTAALGLVGAFCTGSTLHAQPTDELAHDSDIDILGVVPGPPPAKLGKLTHRGVRLDVDFVGLPELVDPDVVASTFYLAPSFAAGAILTDPAGVLEPVVRHVRAVFADPAMIRARMAGVRERMDAGLARIAAAPTWSEAVLRWIFTTSLTTQQLLVAGLRNPTVRRRYAAVRSLLADCGRDDCYPDLLEQLGAQAVDRDTASHHLDRLERVFDAAAEAEPLAAPFAADVTAAARPVAIEGSRAMIAQGDHREAVFWLVVSFARCEQVLAAGADPEHAAKASRDLAACVGDLTGLRGADDLQERLAALPGHRARVDRLAEQLMAYRHIRDRSRLRPDDPDRLLRPDP